MRQRGDSGRDLAGRRWLSGAFVCGGAAPTHTHADAQARGEKTGGGGGGDEANSSSSSRASG